MQWQKGEQLPQALWSFFHPFFLPPSRTLFTIRLRAFLSFIYSYFSASYCIFFSHSISQARSLPFSLSLRSELNPTIISISPSITASRIFLELRIYSAAKLLPPELFLLVVEIWSAQLPYALRASSSSIFFIFYENLLNFVNMIFMDYGRSLPYWQNS